jgi:hypothetical protein
MATADDYAGWIVNNADKKGTPEFNTVAAAYREALAEEQPKAEAKPAAPAPKPAPVAPTPKKAAPVEGSYGAMGEGIDDTVPVPAPKAKPAASAPQIDPTTGKPYPEAAALSEPSVWDRIMMWGGENKAKAQNEYAARRTAAERGITINQAYKITSQTSRPIFNPEGRQLGQASVEAGEAIAKSLPDAPEAALNTALRAIRAGDIPVENRTWLDKAITFTTQDPKQGDLNTQAFANVGQSLGYSAATMVASAIAGSLGTATAGPIGGVVAGFGTSAAVSYGASKDEFLTRLKEKLDKDSKNTFKRPLNEAEWESAKKEFDSAATKYGAWEAVPEALSNLIFLKVFLAPVKAARTVDKVVEYAKRAVVSQPPEHITETITALGQNKAELEAKLTKEELNVRDAFKQQFIQTLAIGGGMAVGAATAQQVNKFYETYVEPKVRPGSALAKAIQADLTDYMNQPTRQQAPMAATNVQPSNVQPPEAVDTLNAAPPAPPADPREQVLTQAYAQDGIPPEQAAQVAQQSVAALNTPPAQPTTLQAAQAGLGLPVTEGQDRVMQRSSAEDEARTTAGRAERAALQMEAPNVPSTEPPSYVTEPSTGEQGIGLPSEPTGEPTRRPASAIERGLDTAERLVGSATSREEQQRPPVDAHYQSAANVLAKAFRLQALPNLAPVFGVGWQQQTMASNPTPDEFQEAAYNHLEELRFLGQRVEGTPVKAKPAAAAAPKVEAAKPVEEKKEKPVEAKPVEGTWEGFPVRILGEFEQDGKSYTRVKFQSAAGTFEGAGARQDIVLTDEVKTEKPKETPSVTQAPKAVETKKEGQAQPAAKPAAPTIAEIEAELENLKDVAESKKQALIKAEDEVRAAIKEYDSTPQKSDDQSSPEYRKLNSASNVVSAANDAYKAAYRAVDKQYEKLSAARKEAQKPVAKPAAPAVEEDRTESLELLATRNEALEVEEEEKALLGINDHLKKWFGTTVDGLLRRRAKGAGPKKKPDTAKTDEERQEQLEDINKLNRDVETLIKATDKYTPIPESEQDGSVEQRERGRTGQYPTEAEYDYAEAVRLQQLDLMRMALHALALRSRSRPIKGYSAAAEYIRNLKPAERARAKKLWEGTVKPTALPVKPKATLTPAQLKRFRAGEKLSKRGRPKKEKTEAVAKTKKAKEAKALAEAREINWETEKPFDSTESGLTEEDFNELHNPPREDTGSKANLMQLFKDLGTEGVLSTQELKTLENELTGNVTVEQEQDLYLQLVEQREAGKEVPPSKAQEEVEDRTIHDELDDDEKKTIAKHYGESSYNEVAQKKFVADVILALNEGLDAVSRVLHDIIKRLQASVLAGIMVMNTSFMTPPMRVAVPTTETRTVQVLAEVPVEAKGMSKAGELAFKNIFPAIQADLKRDNKLFVLTDKPSATVFVFNPDGSLLVQSKVLLGKTLGDYYVGNTEIDINKITPAGLFTLGLRDAARGITERGGDERKTASHYDFGKVFVLDKAIEGKASVTLFHSVWTHEKDAPKRLAALKKAGPEDSRYSFGCINLDKNVYGDLIANHQDQMDGAKMFVVPDEQAATMDFIRGKAITKGDIVRQSTPEITKTITERVPPATSRAEERKTPATLRKEQVAFGRRRRAETEEGGATDLGMEPMASQARDREIAEQQLDMEPDPFFNELESLGGALAYIAGSPNKLESELALRLLAPDNRAALKDVQFVVVEKNDKTIPRDIKKMLNTQVDGYYVPDTKGGTVYVRGLSYGERTQGINKEIVLHEAFHAAGAKKIEYAMLAKRLGFPVDKNLSEAVQELEDLMGRAKAAFDAQGSKANTHLKFLDNADAFTNIQEFYAYGMTDSTMKSFLLNDVSGVIEKTSGFDALINAVLKLFGINPKLKSGLKDLVLISHEIMQAQQPSGTELANRLKEANTEIRLAAKRQAKATATAERDLKASQSPSAIIGSVSAMQSSARDFGVIGTFMENNFTSMKVGVLRTLLNIAPTSTLFKIGTTNGITRLDETKQLIRARGAMRMGIQKEMEAIVVRWRKLSQKQLDLLADTMHLSTDVQEDPSLPVQYSGRIGVKSQELRNLWQQLAQVPDGHKLYKDVRDFYKKAAATFIANLKQQIATSALTGNINDPTSPKGRAFQEILDTYEAGIGTGPYFPLMRQGTNWARFGKRGDVNFQLRENANDLKQFINAQIKERKRLGDKRNMEELRAAGDADFGYDVKVLQDKLAKESTSLRKIFKAIDSATSGAVLALDELKKDIFQMHLLLLPEESFRKMFIPRKNRAGYNRDALQNFVLASSRLSNQLAGSRYNRRISDSLTAAMDSLSGMAGKEKFELLVKEIEKRTENILKPPEQQTGEDFVRMANKFSFMYLLTDFRQAANNLWSLPSKGLPTLVKYFGEVATLKELTSVLFGRGLINQVGVTKTDANGKVTWHAPSMSLSPMVKNSNELRRVAEIMEAREINGGVSMTSDVYLASKGQSITTAERIGEAIIRTSGALHQGSERAAREMLFWSAYLLSRKQKLPMLKAIDKAQNIVEEALFRYAPDEMPPWANKPFPKLMFQFQKFAALNTNFYVVNTLEATGAMPSDVQAGAAKALLGAYMMAILATGIGGAFGVSMMIYLFGVVDGAWEKYANKNLKQSLMNMSPLRWFKEQYLVEKFGAIKLPGTDKTLADGLADGFLDTYTGIKLSSGVSEGSLWFGEPPTALDVQVWLEYLSRGAQDAMLAPSLSTLSQEISGLASWVGNEGAWSQEVEKAIPLKFLRNIAVSKRLETEGYKDRDYDTIIDANEFTKGQLFAQAYLGFRPQAMADIQEANYFIAKNEKMIYNKRNALIDSWVISAKKNDFDALVRTNKKIDEFNQMFPYHEKLLVMPNKLVDALDANLEKALGKERGRQVLDKPEFDWIESFRDSAKLKIIENRGN